MAEITCALGLILGLPFVDPVRLHHRVLHHCQIGYDHRQIAIDCTCHHQTTQKCKTLVAMNAMSIPDVAWPTRLKRVPILPVPLQNHFSGAPSHAPRSQLLRNDKNKERREEKRERQGKERRGSPNRLPKQRTCHVANAGLVEVVGAIIIRKYALLRTKG